VRSHVNLVQEVMKAVMKGPSKENPTGVHYGVIPGTPKPTLYKPGAEVLCATFHIAPSYRVEDLSGSDFTRYRVTCVGTHQGSGVILGEGMGECSSLEEKYKWRKANSNKEFEAAPEDRRRIKYGKDWETKQIRAEHVDQSNTILKMACKRAQVAMTLNVVAASDIFTQDIEDLPEELRTQEAEGSQQQPREPVKQPTAKSAAAKAPEQAAQAADSGALLSDGQKRILTARMESARVTEEQLTKKFGGALATLPGSKFNEISIWIREMSEAQSQ
jgi:hypothetical protein